MISKPVTFRKALIWTLLFAIVLYGTALSARKLIPASVTYQFIPGLLAALAALTLATIIESRFSKVRPSRALINLGFKPGKKNQFLIAGAGMLPILIAYLIIIFLVGKSATLEAGALFLLFKLTVSQGLIEEAVFRGLIFRHLRVKNSIWRAAALSGILFALIHLVNLVKGVSPEILMSLGISIVFAFILTFPLALLFEIGEGSILAGAALHLAVDSVNCFKEVGEPGIAMNIYLTSLIVSSVLVVFLSLRFKRNRLPNG